MTPQAQQVLKHLKEQGSITPVEAAAVYKIRSLSRRICDLKEDGFHIKRTMKIDATGQRYASYKLLNPIGLGTRVRITNEGPLSSNGRYYQVGALGTVQRVHRNDYLVLFDTEPCADCPQENGWYVGKNDLEAI